MEKKVECLKCHKVEARLARVVLNEDGTKNTRSPWTYALLIAAVGITIGTRVAYEWQWLVAALFVITGIVVVTWAILIRRNLARGIEYTCFACEHYWYEADPVESRLQ